MNIAEHIKNWANIYLKESMEENGNQSFESLIYDEKTYKTVSDKIKKGLDNVYSLNNDSNEEVAEIREYDFTEEDFKNFDGYNLKLNVDIRRLLMKGWNESLDEANRPGIVNDREFHVEIKDKNGLRYFTGTSGLKVNTDESNEETLTFALNIENLEKTRLWVYDKTNESSENEEMKEQFKDVLEKNIDSIVEEYSKKHPKVRKYADGLSDFIFDKFEDIFEEVMEDGEINTPEEFLSYIANDMERFDKWYFEENPEDFDGEGFYDDDSEFQRNKDYSREEY